MLAYVLILIASYGRRGDRATNDSCGARGMALSSEAICSAFSTAVRNGRSIKICPRVSKLVATILMGRNTTIGGKRALFVVSRIPCGTTLEATGTGMRITRTDITATGVAISDGRRLFGRGIISRFSLRATHGSLHSTGTALTRTQTRLLGTHGGLSCAMVGDPISNVTKVDSCHMNSLIDSSVSSPVVSISSGDRVCTCFSVARGRVLTLSHRGNSLASTLGAVPRIGLLLDSKDRCRRGNRVSTVDNVVSASANSIALETIFPGSGGVLHDNDAKGVGFPCAGGGYVIVPRATACRLRSGIFICGIMSNGARSARIGIFRIGSKGRCVIRSNLGVNSIVVTRKTKLLDGNVSMGRATSTPATAQGSEEGWCRDRAICESSSVNNVCFNASASTKGRQAHRSSSKAVSKCYSSGHANVYRLCKHGYQGHTRDNCHTAKKEGR